MSDDRTELERHVWVNTKREVKQKEDRPKVLRVRVCSRCGLRVGAELGDVIRPTCAERIVREVMES